MIDAIGNEITPLHESDPELADLLLKVVTQELPVTIKSGAIYKSNKGPGHLGSQRIALKIPSRNEPCPCGSGKKYKKCCL